MTNTNNLLIIIGFSGMLISLVAGIVIFIREDMLHYLKGYFKNKKKLSTSTNIKKKSTSSAAVSKKLAENDSTDLLEDNTDLLDEGTELLREDTELLYEDTALLSEEGKSWQS